MRLDNQAIFSNAQEITTTAVSENVVQLASLDNGMTEVAFGRPIPLLCQVVEDFEGCTSVSVSIETSEDEEFSDYDTLLTTADVALADLAAGYKFPIREVPSGNLGFMRMRYTVTGTATAGAITCGIVDALDNSFQDM